MTSLPTWHSRTLGRFRDWWACPILLCDRAAPTHPNSNRGRHSSPCLRICQVQQLQQLSLQSPGEPSLKRGVRYCFQGAGPSLATLPCCRPGASRTAADHTKSGKRLALGPKRRLPISDPQLHAQRPSVSEPGALRDVPKCKACCWQGSNTLPRPLQAQDQGVRR